MMMVTFFTETLIIYSNWVHVKRNASANSKTTNSHLLYNSELGSRNQVSGDNQSNQIGYHFKQFLSCSKVVHMVWKNQPTIVSKTQLFTEWTIEVQKIWSTLSFYCLDVWKLKWQKDTKVSKTQVNRLYRNGEGFSLLEILDFFGL